MTSATISNATSASRQTLAALSYLAVVAGMMALSIWLAVDFFDRSNAVAIARERLARIDGREKPGQTASGADDPGATGSPFIEGQTITVAGAALQQRVGSAVTKAGGAVLSSQIVVDGPQAKDGFVSLTANVEIGQPGQGNRLRLTVSFVE